MNCCPSLVDTSSHIFTIGNIYYFRIAVICLRVSVVIYVVRSSRGCNCAVASWWSGATQNAVASNVRVAAVVEKSKRFFWEKRTTVTKENVLNALNHGCLGHTTDREIVRF